MLKTEDLIEGNVYYRDGFIFKYIYIPDSTNYKGNIAIFPKKCYYYINARIISYNNNPEREATFNETLHLNLCIKAGTYVDLLDNTNYETIPEIDEILKESIKTNNLNL